MRSRCLVVPAVLAGLLAGSAPDAAAAHQQVGTPSAAQAAARTAARAATATRAATEGTLVALYGFDDARSGSIIDESGNGHTLRIIAIAGIMGGDGHLIEQAEAHGLARFRMMAGRAERAEDIVSLASEHGIDGGGGGTHGAKGRFEGAGRHHGIGIDIFHALFRQHGLDVMQVFLGVGAENILFLAERRQLTFQPGKMGRFEDFVDDLDAVHPFGVAFRGEMIKGGGMGV